MIVECVHCGGEFLAVFTTDPIERTVCPLDSTQCPHCGEDTKIVYAPHQQPPTKDFMHSGEMVTARTPDAYEWWRHNKEFFVTLRYKPRRNA